MTRVYCWECPRGVAYSGLFLLFLYGALRVLYPRVGELAGTVMALLGLFSLLVWGGATRNSAALWLLLLAIFVQVISWVLGYFHHPQWISDNPEVDRLAKLFIFIGVSWWLSGSTRLTLSLWLISFLGSCAAMWVYGGGLNEWLEGLSGKRVSLGIRNWQHSGMMLGTFIIGLVVFRERILKLPLYKPLCHLFYCLAFAYCLVGVAITQTRAVWLALTVVFLALFLFKFKNVSLRRPATHLKIALLFLSSSVFLFFFGGMIGDRLEKEAYVVLEVISGKEFPLPLTSIGVRVNTWVAAIDWISERPLFGWGGEGRGLVIDHTPWLSNWTKTHIGHLHNFFLEVWVAYGLLGLGVIAALAFWIGRGTWLAWRAGVIPNDMALFGAAFFVYWMIVNQFESYNSFWTGVYVHNLIVGGLVTHIWRWQLESGQRVLAWPTRRST